MRLGSQLSEKGLPLSHLPWEGSRTCVLLPQPPLGFHNKSSGGAHFPKLHGDFISNTRLVNVGRVKNP